MPGRWTSLCWATALVGVAFAGIVVVGHTGPEWLWRFFYLPIAVPMIVPLLISGGFHGFGSDAWERAMTFLIAVLMWWAINRWLSPLAARTIRPCRPVSVG
jgi:hypothetical protein